MRLILKDLWITDLHGEKVPEKLELNEQGGVLYDQDRKPVAKSYLSARNALINIIENDADNDSLRVYELGLVIIRDEDLILDSSSIDLLKKVINDSRFYTSLVKGQLLKMIRKAELIDIQA